jgi:putative phosphoribosyl transferase
MNPAGIYRDRRDAGRTLALYARDKEVGADPLVLALPRGGVPVAAEVADALNAPLDVFLVRKLGTPDQPELAMGAIASGGVRLLDETLIAYSDVSAGELAAVTERETRELERRERAYRAGRPPLELKFRPVIVVDDGLATGFTMRAAVAALRKADCARITVAVPVGARSSCEEVSREVDVLVCPLQPEPFRAVGLWYEDFAPTTDEEVRDCLARHQARRGTRA